MFTNLRNVRIFETGKKLEYSRLIRRGVRRLQHVTRVHADPLHRYILLSLSLFQSALFSQLLQHAMAATTSSFYNSTARTSQPATAACAGSWCSPAR